MKEIAFRYFEGRANDAELEELLHWLRNKENRLVFDTYRFAWKESLESGRFPGGSDESWQRLQTQLLQKSYNKWLKTSKMQYYFRNAAVFFFVVSLGCLIWYFTNQSQIMPETFINVVTENGQVSKVMLPDSSVVWLNTGSQIGYSNFFSAENREVTLIGEAYFEVSKSEKHPFEVNCGKLKVKVLGTSFNVNVFEVNRMAEVVLEEGVVELFNSETNNNFYRMQPGELVKVNLGNSQYSASIVNTAHYTSWREGVLNIYNLSIEDLVRRLEKRYNQKFELTPEVREFRYTFTIENEQLIDVLKLMERITPVKVEQKDEIIKIDIDKDKIREVGR